MLGPAFSLWIIWILSCGHQGVNGEIMSTAKREELRLAVEILLFRLITMADISLAVYSQKTSGIMHSTHVCSDFPIQLCSLLIACLCTQTWIMPILPTS
jgi:hypothetical protein